MQPSKKFQPSLFSKWNLWPYDQRHAFANDTSILVATSIHQNESKGDKDISNRLPPNHKETNCIRWALIKKKYELTADSLEVEALKSFGITGDDLPRMAPEVNCSGEN